MSRRGGLLGRPLPGCLPVVLLVLTLTVSGGVTLAQDDQEPCPEGMVCLIYQDVELEIDPANGPVQVVPFQEDTVNSVFLGGRADEKVTLWAIILLSNGDTYEVIDRFPWPDGYADAELGDLFILTESR